MPQANGLQFTAHVGELPSDLFSVVGFTLTERLSELFYGRLELASTNADIDAFSVLEQSVVLVVWQDGAPLRRITGVVNEFAQGGSGHRRTRYELIIQPPLWRLGLVHNSRIFQTQTTDTIVRTLLEERGLVNSMFDLKLESIIPTRFNRQRREVCFVSEGQKEPIFVPWEELVAWVTGAQGATEYGVQRQYGLGIGFYHPETGEKYTLEFETPGLPLAISSWEAIRAYMEYDVHTLKEIQDPLDLQGPDDPPWEGVHVFRNARKRLHDEYREGTRGVFYLVGWYLYHLITF